MPLRMTERDLRARECRGGRDYFGPIPKGVHPFHKRVHYVINVIMDSKEATLATHQLLVEYKVQP